VTGQNNELIQFRVKRAQDTLEDARILLKAKRYNACINRLYYACFYAVTALLAQKDLHSNKHSGVRSLFNLHFVKTQKVPRHHATTYNDLFERRQESDYVDFVSFESSLIDPLMKKAESFVECVAKLIEANT
jgi:uncharacterized protein (UPF0332 family)